MVAPKGNDLGGALSTANKVPYVMEKWNVSDPDAYVVWNMALVDIVEESTCAGFIKSKIPTAADMPAVRKDFGTRNAVRGETEAASIHLDRHGERMARSRCTSLQDSTQVCHSGQAHGHARCDSFPS